MTVRETDVVIIGGGLSGLSLASHLQTSGISYRLLESRSRLGGRIKIGKVDAGGMSATFDLGPSWFWPGQPRMGALVQRLGLRVFEQYSTGNLSFEDERGLVSRGRGYASMEGSYRVAGGMASIVDQLAATLPNHRLVTNASVRSLEAVERNGMEGVRCLNAEGALLATGRKVVVALPPRVAVALRFQPSLAARASQALAETPTWMGGQAKLVAVYDQPFWREAGLSGDAMSRRGPLVEIHDACDPGSSLGALFGFVGVPAPSRLEQPDALKEAAVQQLARIFGKQALSPKQVLLQDWAGKQQSSGELDRQPLLSHPAYGLPQALQGLWKGRLLFGSSETAATFGGYLEGALEAAERVAGSLGVSV